MSRCMLKTSVFILSIFLIFFLFCRHTKTALVTFLQQRVNLSKLEDQAQQYLEDDI